jgi:hypothetical protein
VYFSITLLVIVALFPVSVAFAGGAQGGSTGSGSGADRVPTETKKVPMMHMEEQFRHARGNNLGILRFPYGGEKFAM